MMHIGCRTQNLRTVVTQAFSCMKAYDRVHGIEYRIHPIVHVGTILAKQRRHGFVNPFKKATRRPLAHALACWYKVFSLGR